MTRDTGAEPRISVEEGFEEEWPGASALATECIINLAFLNDRMEAFATSLAREHGIPSVPAFNVLEILRGAGEPLPPSTIAERMILSRATVTGILHSLERRGLVCRLPHGSDARMRLVEITSEGVARVTQFLPRLHEAERRWMDCLTESQQRTLLHLVALLQANAPRR